MTVNRFEEIKRFLHLNDNTKYVEKGQPGHDKLHKVRPLIDALNCQLAKIPVEENVSVDEQIVLFKGGHALKQYNPRKPHKWGYKVFVLSGVSSFSYNFEVFTGAGDNVCLPNEPDFGSSSNVVVRLACRLPSDVNHKLYIDNSFNNLPLQVYLKERGILSPGTVRKNHLQGCPLPSEKEMKKTGRGTYMEKVWRDKGVVLSCVSWYDNKQVNLLSSFAGSKKLTSPVGEVRRYFKSERQFKMAACPKLVKFYNMHMGGVVRLDSILGYYRIRIRSKKWYHRIFFHLLDLSIVNAWLLWKRKTNSDRPLIEFKGHPSTPVE